mmetsp:Transcript_40135/g.103951  ORF Transcript_40135/g.103951 Transcript_40135/m.103951 type:complete len:288 (+) Transcript_40135:130-993(+)
MDGVMEISDKWDTRPKRRPHSVTNTIFAIVAPWLAFFLVICVSAFCYNDSRTTVFLVVSCCAGVSLLLAVGSALVRSSMLFTIAVFCLASVGAGTLFSVWLHDEYLENFWRLQQGKEYKDIHPASNVRKTSDAAVIHFASGSFVDDYRTIGYVSGGGLLCVAPVVVRSKPMTEIGYWAVGEDCCEMRRNFDCGSARDTDALTAIAEEKTEVWNMAISQAMSVYGVNASVDAQLVSFVNDPQDTIGDMWDEALVVSLIALILDLCLCCLTGIVVVSVLNGSSSTTKQL